MLGSLSKARWYTFSVNPAPRLLETPTWRRHFLAKEFGFVYLRSCRSSAANVVSAKILKNDFGR
jgi:hypothetical protein